MRSHYGAIALAISLAASTLAFAQSGGTPAGSANPVAREYFSYGPLERQNHGQPLGRGIFDNTGIGRPNPRNHHQVTPVPEPSEWALMLAGLALVGFIVRRNSRYPHGHS